MSAVEVSSSKRIRLDPKALNTNVDVNLSNKKINPITSSDNISHQIIWKTFY